MKKRLPETKKNALANSLQLQKDHQQEFIVVSVIAPLSFFGQCEVLNDDKNRTFSAKAHANTVLYFISKEKFLAKSNTNPLIMRIIKRNIDVSQRWEK